MRYLVTGAAGFIGMTWPRAYGGRELSSLARFAVTAEMLEDFAGIADIELLVIDADTRLRQFKQELLWNETAYGLNGGWVA